MTTYAILDLETSLKQIAAWSAASWGQAVLTAGPDYLGGSAEAADDMRSLADACAAAYLGAISALQCADWAHECRRAIEEARALEAEGGDSSHADRALSVLSAWEG